jgi:formate-dependent nitrite reductase cytochrome c552 subunit
MVIAAAIAGIAFGLGSYTFIYARGHSYLTNDLQLREAQLMQRRGQFLLDFIEAENSMGFHAGAEAARVLAKSIDYLRQGQILLRDAQLQQGR